MSNIPQALARVKHSSEETAQQQQQQNQNQNPLSCEVCRRRKTKCDRKLPSCTHCIDAKVACHYPEAKQRGPQVGYLAVLESRLVNTEAALHDALSRLYQRPFENASSEQPQQPPVERTVKVLSERYSNMPYSAKTSEWNHQPLLAEEDRQRWWMARQQILAESENQTHACQHHHHQQHQHNHQHHMSSPPTTSSQQPTRHGRTMSHSSARTVDTGEPGFVSPENNASTPSTRAAAAQAPYYHHHSPAEVKSTAASENQHPLSSNPSPGVNVPIHVDPEIAAEMDEEQLMKYF